MSPLVITLIVIAVLIGILVALYFVGNRMQKKQMAQKEETRTAPHRHGKGNGSRCGCCYDDEVLRSGGI